MPVTPTYPGVYIEEIPSGVRTITGVATSITAFVGHTASGPVEKPTRLFNLSEFEATFGPTSSQFDLGYAVDQFFRNGGSDAIIVRVDTGSLAASVEVKNATVPVLDISAKDKGTTGNTLRVVVNYEETPGPKGTPPGTTLGAARDPDNEFNLTVFRESTDSAGNIVLQPLETLRNLSMNAGADNVKEKLDDESIFITAELLQAAKDALKAAVGTGTSKSGPLTEPEILTLTPANSATSIRVNGEGPFPFSILVGSETIEGTTTQERFDNLADKIAVKINNIASGGTAFKKVECTAADDSGNWFLTITSPNGPASISSVRVVDVGSQTAAATLKLGARNGGVETDPASAIRPAVNEPTKSYFLGQGGDDVSQDAQVKGDDGAAIPPIDPIAIGSAIDTLEDVDLFNLLVVPATAAQDSNNAKVIADAALDMCRLKRAFYLLDPPKNLEAFNPSDDDDPDISLRKFLEQFGREKDAAVFFPRIQVPDPARNFRPSPLPSASTVAGICARTDAQRGVWKAPAGTEATIRGATGLAQIMTDRQNGVLNPLGINALRSFAGTGSVVWGSRTMDGNDRNASEWKYVPIRRTALFIEESLYRGTQWALFEPNDEPLWAQLRLNVGAFMQNLFRQGAFQGQTPNQAYLVKVDSESTTQHDINLGIVNVVVGFAPLKPAEFVILKIQQLAGQIAT